MICLSLFLLPGCETVVVQNTKACTVAGILQAGAECAETLTGKRSSMSYEEFIDFLEPRPQQGQIPAHGGAIVQSAEDYSKIKVALEQACIALNGNCTYELQETIKNVNSILERNKQISLGVP